MAENHPYYYLYYNQIVGGLKGAYTNYETDYYYISQTEASNWLIEHIKASEDTTPVKVKATYSVLWQFRDYPEIETSYFRYEERSRFDWDYAIVVNRYISPYKLKRNYFPPDNAIHVIYAEEVPICAVIERKTKDDYYGYLALKEERYEEAIGYYEKALEKEKRDELVYYDYGAALYKAGFQRRADSVLKEGLKVNPHFEPILMYLGNIAKSEERDEEAIDYYDRLININMKYYDAYIELSELLVESDLMMARKILRQCLTINPRYKSAITALADTYRDSDPDIARKYDELAATVE
jgi:tetratricopeptide (TPR) repeat protein